VVYVSNHKSHLDYLIEPLVLDDNGIRPPLLAAGINLFGGALGLLHKHVTGAVPIRRNSKDPLYLVTLRAVRRRTAQAPRPPLLRGRRTQLYRRAEDAEDGLLQAALQADREELSVVPVAIAYDLVLEERIVSREAARKRKRPFGQEVAEMVRHAVGYESRAFVTFSAPIPLQQFEPDSRRDLVTLGASDSGRHRRAATKCCRRRSWPRSCVRTCPAASSSRASKTRMGRLTDAGANLSARSARQAADEGVTRLVARDVLVEEGRKGTRARSHHPAVLRAHDRAPRLGAAPEHALRMSRHDA
jgi:1-acyl-sn-glycerol-3-phosphate acyltransferase